MNAQNLPKTLATGASIAGVEINKYSPGLNRCNKSFATIAGSQRCSSHPTDKLHQTADQQKHYFPVALRLIALPTRDYFYVLEQWADSAISIPYIW